MNRVVITGMGWITPMGHSLEAVWPRLLKGESGISRTTIFDASTFPTTISAEVKDFRLSEHIESTELHSGAGRNTQFALAAAKQAWEAAGLDRDKLDLDRVGIYLGSGEGSLDFDAAPATVVRVAPEPVLDALRERLASVEPDALSPREAHSLLYELRSLLS